MTIQDINASIFIGVVSGVITSFLIWILIKGFEKIKEWYRAFVYQGMKINGEWIGYKAKFENGGYVEEKESFSIIQFEQSANKINGELVITKQPDGSEDRKIFLINGYFYDNNLILNLKTKDTTRMGGGVCVMKLTEDGKKLKGKRSYISSYDSSTISVVDEVWRRK